MFLHFASRCNLDYKQLLNGMLYGASGDACQNFIVQLKT